LATKRQ